MRKPQEEQKKGSPAYMSTYGDLMTLLLTFFVLLFSMSSVDASKFKAFINSFSGGSGILQAGDVIVSDQGMMGTGIKNFPNRSDMEKLAKQAKNEAENEALLELKEELEEFIYRQKLEDKVGVEQRGDEIILRFEDMLLFESGRADIKPGAYPVLSSLGEQLRSYLSEGYHLSIEGHTDNIPIKTARFPSNLYLSAGRAIAVAEFYIEEMDFIPDAMSFEGFGEYRPIADNTTVEGRAQNRRVEIKLKRENTGL
jgi:chemotaxis protein MotB